jgi:rare lipoprotein A
MQWNFEISTRYDEARVGLAAGTVGGSALMDFVKWLIALLVLLTVSGQVMAGDEEGTASYYADSLDGNPTASGEPYDKDALTAAHRTLPFDTEVKVTNLSNGKSVVVRINDRGPHTKNRIIDVSGAAAKALDLLDSGTAKVRIEQQ